MRTQRVVLAACLMTVVGLTGCLGDDIWREPFEWQEAASLGENQDAAQALARGMATLGEQAAGQGDVVVRTAQDLPDNVVFENAKEFFNRQSPGSGDQFQDTVRIVVDNATDAYLTLSGQAAAAYSEAAGPIAGTDGPVQFTLPERTTRLRWVLDVTLTGQQPPEPDQNPTPIGAVFVRITDPSGRVVADYDIDTTRQTLDQVIEGTFGDRNEVRSDLSGVWTVEVDANAEGAWSLVFESYQPKYDDWKFYEFWRAERRTVSG